MADSPHQLPLQSTRGRFDERHLAHRARMRVTLRRSPAPWHLDMLAWHRSPWRGSRLPRSRSPAPRRRQALTRTRWAGVEGETATEGVPVPTFHHMHINSVDPDASLDWWHTFWPSGTITSVGGFLAFEGDGVYLLYTQVDTQAPGAFQPDLYRSERRAPFGPPGPTPTRMRSTSGSWHSTPRETGSSSSLSTPGRMIPREYRTLASARSAVG